MLEASRPKFFVSWPCWFLSTFSGLPSGSPSPRLMQWQEFCATARVTCRELPSGLQTRPDVTIIEVVAVYPGFGAEYDSFTVNDLRAAGTFQPKYLPPKRWEYFSPYFTESLSAWAALNRGTLVAGILILAFVLGFKPVRALRSATI